jgi:lactoylglutathione lyase
MMIKGLFETHVPVTNLKRSIGFYEDILGLTKCYQDVVRGAAFFWIGAPGSAMLGLWNTIGNFDRRHFAFSSDPDFIIHGSKKFFERHDISPYDFFRTGSQPLVFCWMPAVSIYFKDPDEHELEFISMLSGQPRPDLGILSYSDWLKANNTRS